MTFATTLCTSSYVLMSFVDVRVSWANAIGSKITRQQSLMCLCPLPCRSLSPHMFLYSPVTLLSDWLYKVNPDIVSYYLFAVERVYLVCHYRQRENCNTHPFSKPLVGSFAEVWISRHPLTYPACFGSARTTGNLLARRWQRYTLRHFFHPCNSNLKLNYRIKECSHWQIFAKQLEVSFWHAMSDSEHWWCKKLEQSSACKWADAVTTKKRKNGSSYDQPPDTVG